MISCKEDCIFKHGILCANCDQDYSLDDKAHVMDSSYPEVHLLLGNELQSSPVQGGGAKSTPQMDT